MERNRWMDNVKDTIRIEHGAKYRWMDNVKDAIRIEHGAKYVDRQC